MCVFNNNNNMQQVVPKQRQKDTVNLNIIKYTTVSSSIYFGFGFWYSCKYLLVNRRTIVRLSIIICIYYAALDSSLTTDRGDGNSLAWSSLSFVRRQPEGYSVNNTWHPTKERANRYYL